MYRCIVMAIALFFIGFIPVKSMATTINPVLGEWYLFDVDELIAKDSNLEWVDAQLDYALGYQGDGSALSFVFTLSGLARLTVVDAGVAGDIFGVLINGFSHQSSLVSAGSLVDIGVDFDAALSDGSFSYLSLLLEPGTYTITGLLKQSAVDADSIPFNATVGGLRISAVNEPDTFVLVLVGVMMIWLRRRLVAAKKVGALV